MKKDALGSRMKGQYENRTRYYLPRRTYSIIRLDGKNFHTYTKNMKKPFDSHLMYAFQQTMLYLCGQIQCAKLGYHQSDEISILLSDFDSTTTEMWFDGNIQKICSVVASYCTSYFTHVMDTKEIVAFDARIFTIPDPVEVENYFIWRQQDMERNSLQMVAQSYYSQNELDRMKRNDLHELIHKKNDNWNNYPTSCKRGSCCIYNEKWIIDNEIPIFTQNREYISKYIDNYRE